METEDNMFSLVEIDDDYENYSQNGTKFGKNFNKNFLFNQQTQTDSLNNRIISSKPIFNYKNCVNFVNIINNNEDIKEISINAYRIISVIASLLFLFFTARLLFYILMGVVMIIILFSKNGIDTTIKKIKNKFLSNFAVDNNKIFDNEDVNQLLLI